MNFFRGEWFFRVDPVIRGWMQRNGLPLLRISIGIVFFWFGFLKFFPGLSAAQDLAIRTISMVSFGLIPEPIIINGLALWEVLIGLGLITGRFMRETLFLLFLQMPGTFLPVFLFPEEVFTQIPYAPTLEGQYIFKNLVLISAGIVLGGALPRRKSMLTQLEEIQDIKAYDAAKASSDELIPFNQAIKEIEAKRNDL